eukprot:4207735-Pyramimonas_sp.AAC.1
MRQPPLSIAFRGPTGEIHRNPHWHRLHASATFQHSVSWPIGNSTESANETTRMRQQPPST